ncbi:MAG: transposase [Sulfobacillus benefaciens]|uniref:Transposase n=1 Tax=Sulfobacillus benefaciens TaxID=453960 RepID=A0A2T2XLW0_9FIRM|nr:MAG: transposase [Sulfobacillus benefaciens]
MQYIEQEESYTSKASAFDGDEIPVWNGTLKEGQIRGNWVTRGLHRTRDDRTLNGDVNGAANIQRKSNHRLHGERVPRGLLDNPMRVKLP